MTKINPWDVEKIRYRAKRRGFCLMQTRGHEHDRRERAGAGTYMLLDQGGAVLPIATLDDVAAFLEKHDRVQRRRLH
jgi:hypothetical protein